MSIISKETFGKFTEVEKKSIQTDYQDLLSDNGCWIDSLTIEERNGAIIQLEWMFDKENLQPKKLFRLHNSRLEESLKTTIEVEGLSDIIAWVDELMPWANNIKIQNRQLKDNRLSQEWGNIVYPIVADFKEYTEQCIGFCNFYEDENKTYS